MEAGLIMRIECVDSTQRDFVQLMLSDSDERPIFEDEVPVAQRKWFVALEDVATADEDVSTKGDTVVYATWTLGGAEWEGDVRDAIQCLKKCGIQDIYAVVEGDEGWYELWVMSDGKLTRYESWKGKALEALFEGKNNFAPVLDKIRRQALDD